MKRQKKTKENMKKFLSRIKANELYKLPKKRTHEINNRLYWGLGMVPKTNDEIYVSISIGKYIITFHLFSVLYQRRYRCWKYRKWGSHLKNCYHYAKVVENARINFSISPYCTLLFSRKENFKFFEVALSAVFLQWRSWLHYQCVRISTLKYCQYHSGHLLAFQKRP